MERRIKAAGILLAALTMTLGLPFTAEAKDIKSIRLRVEGDITPGEQLADSLPEVTESSSQYYIDYYEFANGIVLWDRKDTPELNVHLYPEKGYRITTKTVKNLEILGREGSYVSHEWLDNDEGSRGANVRIALAPLSTPSAATLQHKEELFAQYDATLSARKAKAAKASAIISGWYSDGNGWWYCEEDGSYPVSAWKELNGQTYYFNESGYMHTGWLQDGDAWYYFDSQGVLQTNTTTPDGCQLDETGAWIH